jgi:GT2 family glycosyltransferase
LKQLEVLNYNNFFIVVVDNKSPNESYERLYVEVNEKKILNNEIYLIESEKNAGYSSGNNIGLKKAKSLDAKYVLVMNNDIVIQDKNILSVMVDFMEKNNKVAMVGPQIINNKKNVNPHIFRPKKCHFIVKNLFFPIYLLYNSAKNDIKYFSNSPIKSYSVSGSFFLLRYKYIEKVNFLDENVFLFSEELILGEKFYKENLDVFYLPYLNILHLHSKTIENVYKIWEKGRIFLKSRMYYINNYREDINSFYGVIIKISLVIKIFFYEPLILFIKNISKNSEDK